MFKDSITEIEQLFQYHSDQKIEKQDIEWVIERWEVLTNTTERLLTREMLREINKLINKVPTGKRRHLHQAKDAILFFLTETLNWQAPAKIKKDNQDKKNAVFYKSRSYRALSEKIYNSHTQQVKKTLDGEILEPETRNIPIFLTQILFDTAPLSSTDLTLALSQTGIKTDLSPWVLEFNLSKNKAYSHWVRYSLSPYCSALYKHALNQSIPSLTRNQIEKSILTYLNELNKDDSPINWQTFIHILRCHWADNLDTWANSDVFNYTQQNALQPERYRELVNGSKFQKISDSYLTELNLFGTLSNEKIKINSSTSSNTKLTNQKGMKLHKELLDIYAREGNESAINESKKQFIPDDIPLVYSLLRDFTIDLINYGGVDGRPLEPSSIKTYISLFNLIKKTHLTNEVLANGQNINEWAKALWSNATKIGTKQKLQRFFKFLLFHPSGELLDITPFYLPSEKIPADAGLITTAELTFIQHSIILQPNNDPLQILFSFVAVTLAFHGCLRREEVLRLRICDCELNGKFSENGKNDHVQIYRLRIGATIEGTTKNKKLRYVALSLLPHEQFALRMLLKLKKNIPSNMPLIGYCFKEYDDNKVKFRPETLSQRSTRYLLPVTKAIKSICGDKSRFHHLRHGGIFLLLNQGQKLFKERVQTPHILNQQLSLLETEVIKNRFNYWHEGRKISRLNKNQLFYEITAMIGHQKFNTTRYSYLHGHEWLHGLFAQKQLNLSKSELRQVWGLKKSSPQLSEKIALIDLHFPEVKKLNQLTNQNTFNFDRDLLNNIIQQSAHYWKKQNVNKQVKPVSLVFFKERLNQLLIKNNHPWRKLILNFLKQQIFPASKEKSPSYELSFFTLSKLNYQLGKTFIEHDYSEDELLVFKELIDEVTANNMRLNFTATLKSVKEINTILASPLIQLFPPSQVLFKRNRKTKAEKLVNSLTKLKKDSTVKISIKNQVIKDKSSSLTLDFQNTDTIYMHSMQIITDSQEHIGDN